MKEVQIAWALKSIMGWGLYTQIKLINHHGSLMHLHHYYINAATNSLKPEERILQDKLQKLEWNSADKERFDICAKNNIEIIHIDDGRYPPLLRLTPDAPLVLYLKGKMPNIEHKYLSIIGTRKASEYGRRSITDFLASWQGLPINIISGLAEGIDGIAHEQAIHNHLPTFAVLGHGLQTTFPAHHRNLSQKIIDEGGGLITEFEWGIFPDKVNFPLRNRIVAGMSEVTWVVESPKKGGSMITANLAQSYHRDIAALPGSIFQNNVEGNNMLIKSQTAHLITEAKDILELLRLNTHKKSPKFQQLSLYQNLSDEEKVIVETLHEKGRIHVDELAIEHSFSLSHLASLLLHLEMNGFVKTVPGKMYELL